MAARTKIAIPAIEADQLYVTHCGVADSVNHPGGFGVRASSSLDAAMLSFAGDFPGHELPLEMWRDSPPPRQAPVRLARVKTPDGRVALVHSSFVPTDSCGRMNSYFSHLLLYDRLSLEEAVVTWGGPQWQGSYSAGADKALPPFAGVPRGTLDPTELAAFLADAPAVVVDQGLARTTFPPRLRGEPAQRRDLVARVLHGCLRVLKKVDPGRSRLYLSAEPGLTALLLYAVARLLPSELVADLTFSTYECPDSTLRIFDQAQVIGTYLPGSTRRLEAEYLDRVGYGVDAFHHTCSKELEQTPALIARLVSLGSAGDWTEVGVLHQLWRRERALALETMDQVLAVRPLYEKLQVGRLSAAELLAVNGVPLGQILLREFEGAVWPLVQQYSLDDDKVRSAFADMLRQRVEELRAQVVAVLRDGRIDEGLTRWAVIQAVAPAAEIEQHWQAVLAQLAQPPGWSAFPLPARLRLLQTWQALAPERRLLPWERQELLHVGSVEELKELAQARVPAAWVGQALVTCAARPEGADWAAGILPRATPKLVQGFATALAEAPDPGRALSGLIAAAGEQGPGLFFLLCRGGVALPPEQLDRALSALKAEGRLWRGHWIQTQNLLPVTQTLGNSSAFAQRLWDVLCRLIDARLLQPESATRQKLAGLFEVRRQAGASVPAETRQTLDDWLLLQEQCASPAAPRPKTGLLLHEAAARRGFATPEELLLAVLAPQLQQAEPLADDELARLARMLAAFFPEEEERRLEAWLRLTQAAPKASRARYQVQIFTTLPPGSRARLAWKFSSALPLDSALFEQMLEQDGATRHRRRWLILAGSVAGAFAAGLLCGFWLGRLSW